MTLKLRCASYVDLRKVQSLSAMITSLLSPHSPDQWVALAIDWLQHRYERNVPIHTTREVLTLKLAVWTLARNGQIELTTGLKLWS